MVMTITNMHFLHRSGYDTMTKTHIKDSGAYTQEVYYFEQQRLACNGKPGMKTKNDVCGVCGGKGYCKGCDGVANSGMLIKILI